jgi:hypothetical protein
MGFRIYCAQCLQQLRPPFWSQFGLQFCGPDHAQQWQMQRKEKMKLPRINVYACQFGCKTVTVDVDVGVTPMFIQCRRKSTEDRPIKPEFLDEHGYCIGTASSCMYPKTPKPAHIKDPEWEWYLPEGEASALLLRPRTDKEPIYHGL